MDQRTGNDRLKETKGDRDWLAIGVFGAVLIVLIVSLFFFIKDTRWEALSLSKGSFSDWAKDLRKYKKVLDDAFTDRQGADKSRRAAAHLQKGRQSYNRKDFQGAMGEFERAIQLDPQNPQAYFWRGRTWMKTEQLQRALADFQEAVKRKPDYAEAHDHLGWLYGRLGRYDEAISSLTRSIELRPNNGWAYATRGRNHFQKGDLHNALKDAEKACQLGFQEGCEAFQQFKGGPRKGT